VSRRVPSFPHWVLKSFLIAIWPFIRMLLVALIFAFPVAVAYTYAFPRHHLLYGHPYILFVSLLITTAYIMMAMGIVMEQVKRFMADESN